MTFNVLTTTLSTFVNALSNMQKDIGRGGHIMSALVGIELVLFALSWALDGGNSPSGAFKKFIEISLWVWFATNFPGFVNTFCSSLSGAALRAGGQPTNAGLLGDPSSIAGMALDVTQPLVQAMSDAGITHPGDLLLDAIAYVILIAAFFLIACQVCVAVIEYYLIVTLASCLIPFGISRTFRFLAEKAIGAAVAVSVKIMVLSFFVALFKPTLAQLHYTTAGEIPLNESLAMCLSAVLMAILVWRAPGVAADLLAGSPSLSTGTVTQHVGGAFQNVQSFAQRAGQTLAAAKTGGVAAAAAGSSAANRLANAVRGSGKNGGGSSRPPAGGDATAAAGNAGSTPSAPKLRGLAQTPKRPRRPS
jgi:type IV secretion system protein TrbL